MYCSFDGPSFSCPSFSISPLMTRRVEMETSLLMLQLSLCVVTVIQMTSSQLTSDISFCRRNEPVLSETVTTNNQLQSLVSQLQKEIAKMKADIASNVGYKGTTGEFKKVRNAP